MRCLAFVVIGLAVASAGSTVSANPGTAPIIGGTQTTVGQYPTVVGLTVGGGICTGTIIDKEWILTAAHCVSPNVIGLPSQQAVTDGVRVYFSTININTAAGRTNVRRASMTIPKASFNINNLGSNDVGLIKLSEPITSIEPSPVNLDPALAPVGTVVTMVGFGATMVGGGGSVGVQFALTARTSTSCSGFGLSNTNLLCFNQQDTKGKCQGDSGGPSFAMIDGKLTVVGITSFGDQDCAQFGADTRTDVEKDFLLTNAPQLDKKCTMDSECNGGICFNSQCFVQPFGPMGLGTECTTGTECQSAACAAGPGGMKCTMSCTPGAADTCPDGFDCLDAGGAGACWPAGEGDGGGCCDAGGSTPLGPALFGLGVFAIVLRRRRR